MFQCTEIRKKIKVISKMKYWKNLTFNISQVLLKYFSWNKGENKKNIKHLFPWKKKVKKKTYYNKILILFTFK